MVVRKDLEISEPRQLQLLDDYRYFFYITNDQQAAVEDVVFSANDRCHRAYMVMASLAWNLKAWLALRLPVSPSPVEVGRRYRPDSLHDFGLPQKLT